MKKLLLIAVVFLFSKMMIAQDITPLNYLNDDVAVSIVDITVPWNNTGINISNGDTVLIFVNGIAATDGSNHIKTITWIGPEGMGGPDWIAGSGLPLPGAASHAVIGKIGDSGTPFYVGRNGSFVSNTTGQLYLGLNDETFVDNYGYYVAFITSTGTVVDVPQERNGGNTQDYSLSQNFPNPFNPSTTIKYNVPGTSNVKLIIYDINGQEVRELINDFRSLGSYSEIWDARDNLGKKVSSGTYFYQVQIGDFIQTKKMILLK